MEEDVNGISPTLIGQLFLDSKRGTVILAAGSSTPKSWIFEYAMSIFRSCEAGAAVLKTRPEARID